MGRSCWPGTRRWRRGRTTSHCNPKIPSTDHTLNPWCCAGCAGTRAVSIVVYRLAVEFNFPLVDHVWPGGKVCVGVCISVYRRIDCPMSMTAKALSCWLDSMLLLAALFGESVPRSLTKLSILAWGYRTFSSIPALHGDGLFSVYAYASFLALELWPGHSPFSPKNAKARGEKQGK